MSYCYVLNRVLIQHLWATVLLTFSVFNTNMRTFHTLHSDRYSVTVSNCVYPKLSHVPHVSGSTNHRIPSIYTKKAKDMGPGWIWSWTGLHLRQSQSDHEWIQHGELYETLVWTDLRCCQLGCVYIYIDLTSQKSFKGKYLRSAVNLRKKCQFHGRSWALGPHKRCARPNCRHCRMNLRLCSVWPTRVVQNAFNHGLRLPPRT